MKALKLTPSPNVKRELLTLLLLFAVLSSPCVFMRLRYPVDGWEGALWGTFLPTDTQFAPGYSESAFARVQVGMSMDQVEALLGRPLSDGVYDGGTCCAYSRSPGDTHYRARSVCFDAQKKVKSIHHEFYVD